MKLKRVQPCNLHKQTLALLKSSVTQCGTVIGKALSCFSMTMQGPYRNGLSRLVWKNLTDLHRALTSTPSSTFGMNWNADCKPGLIDQHQCPTSLMLVIEWKQVPAAMFQSLVEKNASFAMVDALRQDENDYVDHDPLLVTVNSTMNRSKIIIFSAGALQPQ